MQSLAQVDACKSIRYASTGFRIGIRLRFPKRECASLHQAPNMEH